MSGILIYPRQEAERNAFAVKKFLKNLEVNLIFAEELTPQIPCDFVINRTNDGRIAKMFEDRGLRVFNPSSLSFLANDKQKCYEFMKQNGIEILPVNYRRLPCVVKPANGKGGNGVQMITRGDLPQDDNLVYQMPASDLGRDLRVWMIGNEIVGSVLRTSQRDFRANFCLGGEAQLYFLSPEEQELVFRIRRLFEADYIGIDFLFHQGKIIFNEIEDSVGARMLYSLTDTDPIALFCRYIKNSL